MSLPPAPKILKPKELLLYKYAHIFFEKHEDREDFIQTAFLLAWGDWKKKGFKLFNGEPDLYNTKYLVKWARTTILRKFSKEQLTKTDSEIISINGLTKTFNENTMFSIPKNPKDKLHLTGWKLTSGKNTVIFMTNNELLELTGYCRNSLTRVQRLGRKIKIFIYKNRLYSSLKKIQCEFSLSEGEARWRSKKKEFTLERNL